MVLFRNSSYIGLKLILGGLEGLPCTESREEGERRLVLMPCLILSYSTSHELQVVNNKRYPPPSLY